jgi:probable F420-dependent oxidoreductase
MVKLSIATPVVSLNPNAHGPWETTATVEDVARVAETADRLGYHHLTCSEHIALPATELSRRGARYWDPLATLGYLAARTQRIRLATHVLVLAYHHPLEIAKRYGTLDLLSNGRVILGVGVGTMKEEFDLIGAPYDDRGQRGDDAMRALRASLSKAEPRYHGDFYDFEGMVVDPCAVQQRVPIWTGGRTLRSLRRAVSLADGWTPFAVSPDQARQWLDRVELPADFDVVLPPVAQLNPIDEPRRAQDILFATAAAGATIVSVGRAHETLAEYLEYLEALATVSADMRLETSHDQPR